LQIFQCQMLRVISNRDLILEQRFPFHHLSILLLLYRWKDLLLCMLHYPRNWEENALLQKFDMLHQFYKLEHGIRYKTIEIDQALLVSGFPERTVTVGYFAQML